MRRPRLPAFITEVTDDRAALRVLFAACAAIIAAGLDPHILDPGMPSMRAALRREPELTSLFMLAAVGQAGLLIAGGVIADTLRSERLLRLALVGLVVSSAGAVLMPSGIGLLASRALGWTCTGLVLPFAIGAVAMVYRRAARATALGIAYACLGAATAAAPALALALGVDGPRWPAFLACATAAIVALVISHKHLPDLPGARPEHRPYIAATALWAFGVVAVVGGAIQVGDIDPLRIAVILLGVGCVALAVVLRRRFGDETRHVHIDIRPVAVVLAVGIIVGFAQAAPMLQIPLFFQVVQGYSPLLATIAIAPFVLALLLAGPVSGWFLARVGPRTLIAAGVIAIGIADIAFAVLVEPDASYLYFVVPFILIGAGFVIATTVRTAIIFASVPAELPASAAALNEASIGVGGRIGTIVATVLLTQTALGSFAGLFPDLSPDQLEPLIAPFREIMRVVGLPSFAQLVTDLDPIVRDEYVDAAIAGLRVSHLVPGVVAVVGGIIAFFALGPRDPVRSVFDLADERTDEAAASGSPPAEVATASAQ